MTVLEGCEPWNGSVPNHELLDHRREDSRAVHA
jgi:hypothetical protein